MKESIMRQLYITRLITEDLLEKTPDGIFDIIPKGFNNNIRWNFGHIAYSQEKLVFVLSGGVLSLPPSFQEYFSSGTRPTESNKGLPLISEISTELTNQKERIKDYALKNFHNRLSTSYTNSMGVTFYTFTDALLFSFYHEALHVQMIKEIKKVILN
jgi:hypothetical protein